MAQAGDTVKVGDNAIYVDHGEGEVRYGPGAEVPASRFKKSDLDMFTANGSVTLSKAKAEKQATTTPRKAATPAKAKAPKEAGAHAQTEPAPDAAQGDSK